MTSSSSLYGSTPQTGNINSSNLTTLYSGNQSVVPNGNLVVPGTLTVNGCAILTNCDSFSLLPTNAETILFGGAATSMSIGSGSGVTTIQNQLATANYTFPVADGVTGQVLVTDGAGTISFAAASTVGKTYSIDASTTTGGANFNLVSSDPTTDTIKFAEGTGITVVRTDANTITITNTDPGSAGVTSITGTANQVIASSPTGAVTLSLPQDIATTSNPVFAGVTGGNVTVGIVDNNTVATTTGNLIIGDASQSTYYPVLNSAASFPVAVQRFTGATNSAIRSLALSVQSTGTPTVGFGNQLDFQLEAQPGNTEQAGYVNVVSTDLTAGSEDFRMNFGLMQNGSTASNRLSLFSNGDLNMFDGGKFTIPGATNGYSQFGAPATGSNLTYVLPGAAGAANTVLTNDGSGNLSWALPGGGGSTFGNITIAVDTDNTISTTTGDLLLDSNSGNIILQADVTTIENTSGTDLVVVNSNNTAGTITAGQGNTFLTTNLVKGVIRQSGAATNGDVWGAGATGTSNPSRGISIDNTGNIAKRNAVVMRGYDNRRSSIIGEMASGTVASPAVPGAGFTIVEMAAGGYNGGGADGWVSSQGNGYVGRALFAASETWTTTSTGTNFIVGVNPTGYVGIFPQVLAINPVNGQTNIDTFTFANKLPVVGGNAAPQMTVTSAAVDVYGQTLTINKASTVGNSQLTAYAGAVAGSLTWNGTDWTATGGINSNGATLGNITVGVATDNTISTTTGDLVLASATNIIDATTAAINAATLTVDGRSSIDSFTVTTTSTATVPLIGSGRNAMTGLVNIIEGANVHCVNFTALRVDATTALLTTYAEMYNTSALATFTADVSAGDLRLLITPTSATSTVFNAVRTSLD